MRGRTKQGRNGIEMKTREYSVRKEGKDTEQQRWDRGEG